jgi:pilus assembly protein Flp/PilA
MLNKIIAKFQAYKSDVEGATAIEYGLIAGGISLAIVAAVFAFGDDLESMFDTIGSAMDAAASEVETTR